MAVVVLRLQSPGDHQQAVQSPRRAGSNGTHARRWRILLACSQLRKGLSAGQLLHCADAQHCLALDAAQHGHTASAAAYYRRKAICLLLHAAACELDGLPVNWGVMQSATLHTACRMFSYALSRVDGVSQSAVLDAVSTAVPPVSAANPFCHILANLRSFCPDNQRYKDQIFNLYKGCQLLGSPPAPGCSFSHHSCLAATLFRLVATEWHASSDLGHECAALCAALKAADSTRDADWAREMHASACAAVSAAANTNPADFRQAAKQCQPLLWQGARAALGACPFDAAAEEAANAAAAARLFQVACVEAAAQFEAATRAEAAARCFSLAAASHPVSHTDPCAQFTVRSAIAEVNVVWLPLQPPPPPPHKETTTPRPARHTGWWG